MQNMQGMQGMPNMLGHMQVGSPNMQWQQPQQNNMQSQSQPSGFPGVLQGQPCQQAILAPMQNVQLMAMPTGMPTMQGMQFVQMNCPNMMMPNQNQEWSQRQSEAQSPGASGCVVKNTFVHMTEEQSTSDPRRREASEPPRTRSSEDTDDELSFPPECQNSRQFSEPPQNNGGSNGQYLLIPSCNSLNKNAPKPSSLNAQLSMEQQLQQLHQAEQQQLLAQQQMEQQKLFQQQQMELMYQQQKHQEVPAPMPNVENMQEEMQDNTDDEDCFRQYQQPQVLARPMAPTDSGMQWMTATLEGMIGGVRPQGNQVPVASQNIGLQMPATGAMADTGSTPEPGAGKKLVKKLSKKDEDGASSPDQVAHGDSRKKRTDPYNWEDGVVTVMVRQLPRQYTQKALLQEVIRRGFEGLFDFLYLPYDFKKGINVGYGFINFTEPEYALQFRDSLDGQYLDRYMRNKGKAVRVHPAAVQGYEANHRHFAHTKTGQKQDPAFSPLFFKVASNVLQGPGNVQFEGRKTDTSLNNLLQASGHKHSHESAQQVPAKAPAPRMMDQGNAGLLPCQMSQLGLQQRLMAAPAGSAQGPTPQLAGQVGPQGAAGSVDDRQMPQQPRGKAKKQNGQNKFSQPMLPTFNSGGVTWVGIPVGTAAAANWLEASEPAPQEAQQGVTYGWIRGDMDLNN